MDSLRSIGALSLTALALNPPATALASQPANETIVVRGTRLDPAEARQRAKDFVKSTGVANGQKQVARWVVPICIKVIGVSGEQSAKVTGLMLGIAREANIAVAKENCDPNITIRSPELLDGELRLKAMPHIRFAGQITGCEGYVESAAIGLLAARFATAEAQGRALAAPPPETALGALLGHITGGADAETYQPMNINFGLMPPLEGPKAKKADRKRIYTDRARAALKEWLAFSSSPRPGLGEGDQAKPGGGVADSELVG